MTSDSLNKALKIGKGLTLPHVWPKVILVLTVHLVIFIACQGHLRVQLGQKGQYRPQMAYWKLLKVGKGLMLPHAWRKLSLCLQFIWRPLQVKVISKGIWVRNFNIDLRWPTWGSENRKRPHVATCVTQVDSCVYSSSRDLLYKSRSSQKAIESKSSILTSDGLLVALKIGKGLRLPHAWHKTIFVFTVHLVTFTRCQGHLKVQLGQKVPKWPQMAYLMLWK